MKKFKSSFASSFVLAFVLLLIDSTEGKNKEKAVKLNIDNQLINSGNAGFEENRGQITDQHGNRVNNVLFKFASKGLDIYVTTSGLTYVFTAPKGNKNQALEWTRTNMTLRGATIKKENILMENSILKSGNHTNYGPSNYYLRSCPNGIFNVLQYDRITIKDIYTGIDWTIYKKEESGLMNQGSIIKTIPIAMGTKLEYDFVIHPGADPGLIEMKYEGADQINADDDFHGMKIKTSLGEIHEMDMRCYEKNSRRNVSSNYKITGNTILLETEKFDNLQDLIIDPTLEWSTYYGGSDGWDEGGDAIAIDKDNNILITGQTRSAFFPVSSDAYQGVLRNAMGLQDAFIIKLDENGKRLWATYYGGSNDERAYGITTDNNMDIAITGATISTDFPVTSDALQGSKVGNNNAFVVQLDSSGKRKWATYYGGGSEESTGITSDQDNNLIITGYTQGNFPTYRAYQAAYAGTEDIFIVKMNSLGALKWATYYGGNTQDRGFDVTADASGNIFVTGITETNFPVSAGAFQTSDPGQFDAFIIKLDSSGTRLWASYCGGSGYDEGWGIKSDLSGNIYVCGRTASIDFPASTDAFQPAIAKTGEDDAFLIKFDNLGHKQWATYCGGTSYESAYGLSTDACGNVFIAGQTFSTNFPTSPGRFQNSFAGDNDAFIVEFDNSGSRLWGSYYGGNWFDHATGIACDANDNIVITGRTESDNLPIFSTNGSAFQTKYNKGGDVFIAKFGPFSSGGQLIISPDITICPGNETKLTVGKGAGSGYNWAPGVLRSNLTKDSVIVNPTISTTYTVTDNSTGKCSGKIASVKVTVNPLPTINAGADITINSGSTTTLIAQGNGKYSWSPSEGLSCTSCQNIQVAPASRTTYYVKIIDSNGCSSSDSITVFMEECAGEIFIPNAFSPNGDNKNEILYVRDKCIKTFIFSIYNRWGEKVFETSDITQGWDGGSSQGGVVFFYYINGILSTGELFSQKGNVCLIK